MKLGVGYNVFSGAELLKPSILCVRDLAAHIIVVYSRKSIIGTDAPAYLLPLLDDLQKQGLVDQLIEIEHDQTDEPLQIQAEKRRKYELARTAALQKECTHFMGRDCDEFFGTSSLRHALDIYGQDEMVVCPVLDYVKRPTLRSSRAGPLHVTVFHQCGIAYGPLKTEALIDLSRTVKASKVRILRGSELAMHHMTGVRLDANEMNRKFEGHSHFCSKGQASKEEYLKMMRQVDVGTYEACDDVFGIETYWKGEFRKYHE